MRCFAARLVAMAALPEQGLKSAKTLESALALGSIPVLELKSPALREHQQFSASKGCPMLVGRQWARHNHCHLVFLARLPREIQRQVFVTQLRRAKRVPPLYVVQTRRRMRPQRLSV